MKIAFICGCLEPGHDGVGDYTRRFAIELIRHGHNVFVLAFNDSYATETIEGVQQFEDTTLKVLRLPHSKSQIERLKLTQAWISNFNPEWISLQFVPFSFNKKGLPFLLGYHLKKLGKHVRWNIMFHELWVGMDKNANLKLSFLGWLQKKLIFSMIGRLEPSVIHTQTNLYKLLLAKKNKTINYLALFPNIEPPQNFTRNLSPTITNTISIVYFGSIHPNSLINDFAKDAAQYAFDKKVAISLTLMGRNGKEQDNWKKIFESENIPVIITNEISRKQISEILNTATMGLTTNPVLLAEKSSSIASMHSHGVPIISVSKTWAPRYLKIDFSESNVYQYSKGNFHKCITYSPNDKKYYTTTQICSMFESDLCKFDNSKF